MTTMTDPLRALTLLALMGLGAAGQERTAVKPNDTGVGLTNPCGGFAGVRLGFRFSVG